MWEVPWEKKNKTMNEDKIANLGEERLPGVKPERRLKRTQGVGQIFGMRITRQRDQSVQRPWGLPLPRALEDQEGGHCGRNLVGGDRHPGQASNGSDHARPWSNVRNSTFALSEVGSHWEWQNLIDLRWSVVKRPQVGKDESRDPREEATVVIHCPNFSMSLVGNG